MILELNNSQQGIDSFRAVFLERLKVPHADIDNTFSEYSSFETKFDNREYTARCKLASSIVEKTILECRAREKFELDLIESSCALDVFCSYIDYENGNKNILRTITLFERAINIHCLDPLIWNTYLTFLILNLSFVKAEEVAKRAVRNCMYNSEIWCHYLASKSLSSASDLDGCLI
jgi:hypothetical protein